MKYLLLAAIVCLLVGTAHGLTHYTYNYNTVANIGTNVPYYNLGYLYAGNTLMINLTVPGTANNDLTANGFTITISDRAATPVTATLTCTAVTTATTCSVEHNITTSQNYFITFVEASQPANDDGTYTPSKYFKLFYLDITSYLTTSGGPGNSSAVITTLKKSTEVFRNKIAKLIYVGSTGQRLKFSMWPVAEDGIVPGTPDRTNSNLHLYKVGTTADSGTDFLIDNANNTDWLNSAPTYFAQVGWTAANRRITYVQT